MSSRRKLDPDSPRSSLCGLLVIDKPGGMTSRDVVNEVQRLVRPLKVGHAGTLDPLATGVLVVCLGSATRLIRYIQEMPKRYLATFQLGVTSDTDDIEAALHKIEGTRQPDREEIERALETFRGTIWQTPPRFSAVKVKGKRAYALARDNQDFELAPRQITIENLQLLQYEFPRLSLDIQCSSGTYVRSLGRDLGQLLGTGAVMSALRRTAIGNFLVEDAHPVGDIASESLAGWLLPAPRAVENLARVRVTPDQAATLRRGIAISFPDISRVLDDSQGSDFSGTSSDLAASSPVDHEHDSTDREWVALDEEGNLVAIVESDGTGRLHPRKCFGF